MSIISSIICILLCSFSMHGYSEARYIGLGRGRKGSGALFRHIGKGQFLFVEKLKLGVDSSTKGPLLAKKEDTDERKGTHGGAIVGTTTTSTKGTEDYSRTSSTSKSDAVNKPLVSASWSVPHRINNPDKITNHGDKITSSNPGIYSDYSRPRMRIMEYATSEIFESSSSSAHMGLHKDKATSTINEESRRRALYAKETRHYFENTYKVDDDEDDDDGVVLADYKPPHQTPPIHNKRT